MDQLTDRWASLGSPLAVGQNTPERVMMRRILKRRKNGNDQSLSIMCRNRVPRRNV